MKLSKQDKLIHKETYQKLIYMVQNITTEIKIITVTKNCSKLYFCLNQRNKKNK
jgi:hypothetical protein